MIDPRELLNLLDNSDDEEELPILIPPIPTINPRNEERHGKHKNYLFLLNCKNV